MMSSAKRGMRRIALISFGTLLLLQRIALAFPPPPPQFRPRPTTARWASVPPRHVAFICDGNSRWAHLRGLPASAGHWRGAERLVRLLEAVRESRVEVATLFVFSTENWRRPASERDRLWEILEASCRGFAHDKDVRVKILGDWEDERIPSSLRLALHKLETDSNHRPSANNTAPFTLCLAINYGGRRDIVNASLRLAQAIASGQVPADQVDEDLFSSYLVTRDIPDPDLIVRTSGECRLSNFLLWNAAYAELYVTDQLWPDFDAQSWKDALEWYSQRQRKFGGRSEEPKNGVVAAAPSHKPEPK